MDLRQATADRRNDFVATKFTDTRHWWRFWIEVHIDIQRPCDQVAGFQRAAQPAIQQVADMLPNILVLAYLVNQTLRLNADQHRNTIIIIKHLLQSRNKVRHLSHCPQTNTAELNWRPWLQAAYRVLKEHQVVDVIGIERILNAFLIVKQSEGGFLRHRLSQIYTFRHVKTDAPTKQRGE